MKTEKVISTGDFSDKPRIKCPRCGSRHVRSVKQADGTYIQRCNDCRKVMSTETPAVFQGEMMTCCMCGKQQQSNPDQNSDWRIISLKNKNHYVCTDHFPPDGSSKEAFSEAYEKVLRHLGVGGGSV